MLHHEGVLYHCSYIHQPAGAGQGEVTGWLKSLLSMFFLILNSSSNTLACDFSNVVSYIKYLSWRIVKSSKTDGRKIVLFDFIKQ